MHAILFPMNFPFIQFSVVEGAMGDAKYQILGTTYCSYLVWIKNLGWSSCVNLMVYSTTVRTATFLTPDAALLPSDCGIFEPQCNPITITPGPFGDLVQPYQRHTRTFLRPCGTLLASHWGIFETLCNPTTTTLPHFWDPVQPYYHHT